MFCRLAPNLHHFTCTHHHSVVPIPFWQFYSFRFCDVCVCYLSIIFHFTAIASLAHHHYALGNSILHLLPCAPIHCVCVIEFAFFSCGRNYADKSVSLFVCTGKMLMICTFHILHFFRPLLDSHLIATSNYRAELCVRVCILSLIYRKSLPNCDSFLVGIFFCSCDFEGSRWQ